MVVKMMKWRPWPPLSSKNFETKIIVRSLEEGLSLSPDFGRVCVEIKWKGSKGSALRSLRRSVKRNFTKEEGFGDDGVVEWNEEFQSVCGFSAYKEGLYNSWEVVFTVFNGLNQGPKNKLPVVATGSLNLAEFASVAEEKEIELSIPLTVHGGSVECCPSLCISLSLLELRTAQELSDTVQRSPEEALPTGKDEPSAIKAGLRKVKIFSGYVTDQRAKKACREEEGSDGKSSLRSEDTDSNYPFDTDSLDDLDEAESEEGKEDTTVQKSFSYGTLAYANQTGLFYSNASQSEDCDLIYYTNRGLDVGSVRVGDSHPSDLDQSSQGSSKRSILSWRKRKLSFRSPKPKGEPLLKKGYGEEGGDDIDFDRRQFSSSDESTFKRHNPKEDSTANGSSESEFGDDHFAVGSWENTEVVSRDGNLKLQTQVFFASIDQRSERASGESACTALVAVIADWFQSNSHEMPIKSQLDSLIREGSLEWRNLCENIAYRNRFPDKHFDLETVLDAKIRALSVIPEKSFIGFFHPEGLEDEEGFDFLRDAMSFDGIWDEINRVGSDKLISNREPLVYIVSWNDHFFILKVEADAYYIIDTLGERLYEGCNQAFILKFDKDTVMQRITVETEPADENSDMVKSKGALTEGAETVISHESENSDGDNIVVCGGKESCKEYIKSFLAAIPINELKVDLKKGLLASTPLHHRLQIELHYTQCLKTMAIDSSALAEV